MKSSQVAHVFNTRENVQMLFSSTRFAARKRGKGVSVLQPGTSFVTAAPLSPWHFSTRCVFPLLAVFVNVTYNNRQ